MRSFSRRYMHVLTYTRTHAPVRLDGDRRRGACGAEEAPVCLQVVPDVEAVSNEKNAGLVEDVEQGCRCRHSLR